MPINIIPDSTITILAKRNTGKSMLCKYLIYYLLTKYKYDNIVIVCPSMHNYNKNISKDNTLMHAFDDEKIWKVIKHQQKVNPEYLDRDSPDFVPSRCLMVFDDNGEDLMHSTSVKNISTNGRQLCITAIFVVQTSIFLSPTSRINNDYIFFGKLPSENIDKLKAMTTYSGSISNFYKLIKANTEDFNFLLYDNKKDEWGTLKADLDTIKKLKV